MLTVLVTAQGVNSQRKAYYPAAVDNREDSLVRGRTVPFTTLLGAHNWSPYKFIGAKRHIIINGVWVEYVYKSDTALVNLVPYVIPAAADIVDYIQSIGAALFTTSQPYISGSLIIQECGITKPPSEFIETSPTSFTLIYTPFFGNQFIIKYKNKNQ